MLISCELFSGPEQIMSKKLTKSLRLALTLISFSGCALASPSPLEVLETQYPSLHKLYVEYRSYEPGLSDYAKRQGFRRPFELLGTVVHEKIHIASMVHQGFFIDGVYYEPYLKKEAWPTLTNNDVRPHMVPEERGTIYSLYVLNTPGNRLGNVLDEINAYSHVAAFICKNEPESAEKQTRNLIGLMHLQEAFLRVTRQSRPDEYLKVSNSREVRGAIQTISTRAVQALRTCGVADVIIPSRETNYFLLLDKRPPLKR